MFSKLKNYNTLHTCNTSTIQKLTYAVHATSSYTLPAVCKTTALEACKTKPGLKNSRICNKIY